jgi:hypothetical protein
MAKGKVKSSSSPGFAKGGSTKMHGKQAAGPQKSGTSAHSTSGSGGKFASGGSTKMHGKQSAVAAPAGRVQK